MSNYHIVYERSESVKYVSHLDFVRMFGRAIRRAEIPIAYSEGFNPHPLLTFALPLPVSHTSECEILEITLAEELSPQEIMDRLNKALPLGVRITEVIEGKSLMKKLDNALYVVKAERLPESVDDFLNRDTILIEKKTKSGIKETDIRPDIKEIKLFPDRAEMVLSAGSRANIKPEVIVLAMNKYIEGYDSGECSFHRKNIYDIDMHPILRGE